MFFFSTVIYHQDVIRIQTLMHFQIQILFSIYMLLLNFTVKFIFC